MTPEQLQEIADMAGVKPRTEVLEVAVRDLRSRLEGIEELILNAVSQERENCAREAEHAEEENRNVVDAIRARGK